MDKMLKIFIVMIACYFLFDLPEFFGYLAFIPGVIYFLDGISRQEEEQKEELADLVVNKIVDKAGL